MGVGHDIEARNAGWSFADNVAETFVDHIRQSVPLYEEGHDLICQLTDFFVKPDSLVYELGTSTGELIRKMAMHNSGKPNVRWTGIDIEPAMVAQAAKHCSDVPAVKIIHDDARFMDLDAADMIVSYYTMQFIPPRYRQDLITKIYDTLNWGGAFVMFEKVRGPDARFQDILSQLYIEFKMRNGFDSEEILEKQRSLKGVLEPFSTQGNLDLLSRAGFQDVTTVQKSLCFEGFLAIK